MPTSCHRKMPEHQRASSRRRYSSCKAKQVRSWKDMWIHTVWPHAFQLHLLTSIQLSESLQCDTVPNYRYHAKAVYTSHTLRPHVFWSCYRALCLRPLEHWRILPHKHWLWRGLGWKQWAGEMVSGIQSPMRNCWICVWNFLDLAACKWLQARLWHIALTMPLVWTGKSTGNNSYEWFWKGLGYKRGFVWSYLVPRKSPFQLINHLKIIIRALASLNGLE